MNRRKSISLALCLAMAASMGTATGVLAEGDEAIELTFQAWDGGSGAVEETVMYQIVEDFNAEYEGKIKIIPEFIPSEQTKTKLPTLMAANDPPDIFMTWPAGYLQPYVEAGKVYSLQEALDSDPEWKAQFLDGIMDPLVYDGEIYGIPTSLSAHAVFYNQEIVDRLGLTIPETEEEFVEFLKAVRDSGEDIIPLAFGNSTAWPSASLSEVYVNRIGGTAAYENAKSGEGSWTDEAFIKAAEHCRMLAEENLVPEGFAGMAPEEAVEQFKSGKAACIRWSSYASGTFEAEDSAVRDKVTVTKCPVFADGAGDVNAWVGKPDRNLAVSEKCENKEAAVEFIKYFTQIKYMQTVSDGGSITSVRSDYLDTSNFGPILTQLLDLQKDMTGLSMLYDLDLGTVIGNEYNNTIQGIMSGDDAAEALENFQNFFNENYTM